MAPNSMAPNSMAPNSMAPNRGRDSGRDSDGVTTFGGPPPPGSQAPVVIDCDDCAVRGPGCRDCVVSVLLGVPETLLQDERAALEVLAEVGLAPRLRLVPIHRGRDSGVA